MAISYAGSPGAPSTANVVTLPATVNAGDLLLIAGVLKYPTTAEPNAPDGWTKHIASGGAGASGEDSGEVYAVAFTRVADGSEGGTTVTFTYAGSVNVRLWRAYRFTKDPANTWSIASAAGSADTGGDTAWSSTAGTDPGVAAGDVVVAIAGLNNNVASGISDQSITAPDATISEASSLGVENTAAGDDTGFALVYAPVTSGTASAPPTLAATLNNGASGATIFVRLREVPPAISASLSSTLGAATLAGTASAPAAGALTATLAAAVLAAAAEAPIAGEADVTLDACASAATAVAPVAGSGAHTLDDATLVATGALAATGALSAELEPASCSSTAAAPVAAVVDATLDDAGGSAGARVLARGTLSATLGGIAALLTGGAPLLPVEGELDATLADVVLVAAGGDREVAAYEESSVTLDDERSVVTVEPWEG